MTSYVNRQEPSTSTDAVVAGLLEARATGRAPEAVATLNAPLEAALRLQLLVLERLQERGEEVSGWKLGLTAGPARQLMGGFRPFGYLLASRTFRSGAQIGLAQITRCLIEPELCLVLGSDLRGQVSAEQAFAAVRAVAPAFELNELRLPPGATHAALVADGVANWGLVVGPESPVTRELRQTRALLHADAEQVADSTPGDELDDPYETLARLAATLDRFGLGLAAGQFVLTGAFSVKPVESPSTWRAEFGGVGSVEVRFS